MRRLNQQQYAQEMRARGIPVKNIGSYGEGNPNVLTNNVYSEREVFRGEQSSLGGAGVGAVAEPIRVIRNRIFFSVTPFSLASGDGSVQMLGANEMRRFLSVQNQSLTDLMYVNFSVEAAANVGVELYPAQALIYDYVVPYNAIQIFVNVATKQRGVIVEGALQL